MTRAVWIAVVAAVSLAVGLPAAGVRVPWLDGPVGVARPAAVPDGDQELAWIHTSTNGTTWERFVAGVVRAQLATPGLTVDDSAAFADATTSSPEVVLGRAGHAGKLRIRWYKLTSDVTSADWVRALAKREPPPLALVGGGSSDRAVDLARALAAEPPRGPRRPLLFLTTATADEYCPDDAPAAGRAGLIGLYAGRTFRFCFTNQQMARAVVDYAWKADGLHPAPPPGGDRPTVLSAVWRDDPFSTDLHERFGDALSGRAGVDTVGVPFSVGGQAAPNVYEAEAARAIQAHAARQPGVVVLVLPTVTNPARRLLRAVLDADPALRTRLVAVTGDGIPVNAVYRDGEFAWPAAALPVPLVMFCHNDPADWDGADFPAVLAGYKLAKPNATEEVRHFTDIAATIADAAFAGGRLAADPDAIAARLRDRTPALFADSGERLGGTGEYVCVLRPRPGGATLDVARRNRGGGWDAVRTVDVAVPPGGHGGRE